MTTEKEKYCLNQTSRSNGDIQPTIGSTSTDQGDRTHKIRELNDRLRMLGSGGMWLATISISSLPPEKMRAVYEAVLSFNDFTPDNDPHGEHDCAIQSVGDLKVMWKIDYYDRARQFHSPDPSDPKVTVRVLTVMLASEY